MVKGPNTHQFLAEKRAASSETAEKTAAFTLSSEDAMKQLRAARSCKNLYLQGANLREANLYNARLCNTSMPEGSINNNDC